MSLLSNDESIDRAPPDFCKLRFKDESVSALITSDLSNQKVELWTSRRMPFEPTGMLRRIRDALRTQLRGLKAKRNHLLEMTYTSQLRSFVDTENVLIYNIRTSALRTASQFGLSFRRIFSEPPTIDGEKAVWRHYHNYSIVRPSTFESANASALLDFDFEMQSLSASCKPHHFWWAAKQAAILTNPVLATAECFGITIRILGPVYRGNVASIVKPLFDGLISALHWSNVDSEKCAKLIALDLGVSANGVAQLIENPTNCILGSRRVVSPYRGFVKWNPADDRCISGQLSLVQRDSCGYRVEVEIVRHTNMT